MAVYTRITEDQLAAFLDDYDLGQAESFTEIDEGSENSNYLLKTRYGHYVLTLYEGRVNSRDLPYFLGLIDHLANRAFPCPRPIYNRTGRIYSQIASRQAAICTVLPGSWMRHPQPHHCAALGEILARLHRTASDFLHCRANALDLDGCQRLIEARTDQLDCLARPSPDHEPTDHEPTDHEPTDHEPTDHQPPDHQIHADHEILQDIQTILQGEIRAQQHAFTDMKTDPLSYGTIHADLFPDNLLFTAGAVSGVIDFYFACTDRLLYDLAVGINAWCFKDNNQLDQKCVFALWEGYLGRSKLSYAETRAFPWLCRFAALRFLATRLFDWQDRLGGSLAAAKDPYPFWQRLIFHRANTDPGVYGL